MFKFIRQYTKVIMAVVILLFVASCFAGYGLYTRNKGGENGMRDYPVAESLGRQIMRSSLEKAAQNFSSRYGSNITSNDIPYIRLSALQSIVIETELKKEIENRKIEITNDEIEKSYKEMMDRYPTREEFMENMKRTGQSEKKIKEDIKKDLQMQKLIEGIADNVKVEESEVKAFYNSAKDFLFKQHAGTKTLIATFSNKKSAEAARAEILKGASWDPTIDKYKNDIEMSTPVSAPAVITKEMMQSKELSTLANYKFNEITKVEDAGAGHYFIAYKMGETPERIIPFEEAKKNAEAMVKDQKMRGEQSKFYKSLYDRAEVKILDEKLFPPKQGEPASKDSKAAPESK